MMIPQRLSPELTNDATPSPPRARAPLQGGWRAVLVCTVTACLVLGCTGTIDDNEQSYTLAPRGTGGGSNAVPASGSAPAARTPAGAVSGSDGEQPGGNISGLDNESADDDRRGGGSRRTSTRDRDRDRDDEDEDVDAGIEEPLEDAGVLEDAGIADGGVLEVDGGVADAGAP